MNDTIAVRRRARGGSMTGTAAADEALTALYAGHYRSLLRLAALLLDDLPACEDVVQEAYVRVYRSWDRIDDYDKALAYLRQTVVNLARSTLRRRLVAARHVPRPGSPAPDPAYAAVERDALVRALRSLPRRQREALTLRYFADLTEAQTAAAMGCGVGTVKGYASRGLATLNTRLEEAAR
jgi:RNA polymerase sigma-70 factor (sigma-E family)